MKARWQCYAQSRHLSASLGSHLLFLLLLLVCPDEYAAQAPKHIAHTLPLTNLVFHSSERTTSLSVFRMKCSFRSIFARSSAVRANSICGHSQHPSKCYSSEYFAHASTQVTRMYNISRSPAYQPTQVLLAHTHTHIRTQPLECAPAAWTASIRHALLKPAHCSNSPTRLCPPLYPRAVTCRPYLATRHEQGRLCQPPAVAHTSVSDATRSGASTASRVATMPPSECPTMCTGPQRRCFCAVAQSVM